ncbi:MAG: Zn-ribbon domain-containing OB-fold protein [Gammaproteobacteria bacterium]|nr:Zn-ribbon domain-containing OB-fold protein [Gammaproteobacteria bacterium]
MASRPLPQPTPETQHFWDGARCGELRLQRCQDCLTTYFPPRPFCPECSSRNVTLFKASGRGTLESYVINHRPHPAWTEPYAIALVRLEEGPRLMSNIVDCPQTPEALILDMPLEVVWHRQNDQITLPLFKPTVRPAVGPVASPAANRGAP